MLAATRLAMNLASGQKKPVHIPSLIPALHAQAADLAIGDHRSILNKPITTDLNLRKLPGGLQQLPQKEEAYASKQTKATRAQGAN